MHSFVVTALSKQRRLNGESQFSLEYTGRPVFKWGRGRSRRKKGGREEEEREAMARDLRELETIMEWM